MNRSSPYDLLHGLEQFGYVPAFSPVVGQAQYTNLLQSAERWQQMQQAPASTPAPIPPSPSIPTHQQSATATEAVQPSTGPRMRTPPPMYPPTGYPVGIPSYNAPQQPLRHAHYDAILAQHKSASKNAIFTSAPLE